MTTELAIHPPGATHESFEWRISIARLLTSTPFSVFAGIERYLATLEGEMALLREGTEPLVMNPNSPPARFSGEIPATGQVIHGPVLDLNVMYRADRWNAVMRRWMPTGETFAALANATFICSRCASLPIDLPNGRVELGLYDMLRVDEACDIRIREPDANGSDFYTIELRRTAS